MKEVPLEYPVVDREATLREAGDTEGGHNTCLILWNPKTILIFILKVLLRSPVCVSSYQLFRMT